MIVVLYVYEIFIPDDRNKKKFRFFVSLLWLIAVVYVTRMESPYLNYDAFLLSIERWLVSLFHWITFRIGNSLFVSICLINAEHRVSFRTKKEHRRKTKYSRNWEQQRWLIRIVIFYNVFYCLFGSLLFDQIHYATISLHVNFNSTIQKYSFSSFFFTSYILFLICQHSIYFLSKFRMSMFKKENLSWSAPLQCNRDTSPLPSHLTVCPLTRLPSTQLAF